MKNLPSPESVSDMWESLKRERRPIVIYGMGNGADKLIARFDSLGIKYADIFASDGFVRGHSFHGVRVKSFSEIKELYPDFVIVLSFATRLPDLIDTLLGIDEEFDMYVPDMPVSDEGEYFDSAFYKEHYGQIKKALDALYDEESKNVFISVIRYKLSGRMRDILEFTSTKEEMYSLLSSANIETLVDAGAYSGDTLSEAVSFFPNLRAAVCIEPDPKTFKRLARFAEGLEGIDVRTVRAAAWDKTGDGFFAGSGNRNSSVLDASTHSYQHRVEQTPLVRIDDLTEGKTDYVKYDVEGSEREALSGSDETIRRDRPQLLVSLYHKSRDIFELVNILRERYPYYKMYIRRLRCLPAWEINLIMLPV
ncbi:MAG: FkbM family methyltransferase [Clostridia bacterium]|nr:FkbM family methyltransferase [Clostridia bacterium]